MVSRRCHDELGRPTFNHGRWGESLVVVPIDVVVPCVLFTESKVLFTGRFILRGSSPLPALLLKHSYVRAPIFDFEFTREFKHMDKIRQREAQEVKEEQEESAYAPASEASGAVNEYHARCSTGTCK